MTLIVHVVKKFLIMEGKEGFTLLIAGQKEMQQMDQYTIEKLGLPGVVLMENAGAKVVEEIILSSPVQNPKVIVLAGGGNNGGDGFVIARRLCDIGMDPLLCLLVHPNKIKGDAKIHYDVYVNRGLPLFLLENQTLEHLKDQLRQADIIVDAILGTGVNGPVREPLDQVIEMINESGRKKTIISVDIPSGLSSDTGKVDGAAVCASKTITFAFPKKGFFLQDGPKYIGEWKVVDISVPPSIAYDLKLELPRVITKELAMASIPERPMNGHKGTFGHVLVLGGSRHFIGAPIFAAKAALYSGAGLVTLAVPESIYPMVAAQNPESLFLPLPDTDGHFSKEAVDELAKVLDRFDSIAAGPGMGRFPGGEEWMTSFFSLLSNQSIVIDADALYLLRNHLDLVKQYKGDVIFTPHPGEMAAIVGKTVKEVEEYRIEYAETFAKNYQIHLLLKGHRTIIACPDGSIYINPYGHDALGKGGSGDVLSGIIGSFLAQGALPLQALVSAVYLHARAGEEKAKTLSHYGVTPIDITNGVRELLTIGSL
jgi:hydroxyethylthiazole kinase-like uncharacterized protein yjeF